MLLLKASLGRAVFSMWGAWGPAFVGGLGRELKYCTVLPGVSIPDAENVTTGGGVLSNTSAQKEIVSRWMMSLETGYSLAVEILPT